MEMTCSYDKTTKLARCILVKLYMSLGTESRREKPPVCGANVNGKRKDGRPRGPRGPGRKLPGAWKDFESEEIVQNSVD